MFAKIFVQLLQTKNTTALELSKKIGVPKSIVYEWKNGKRQPSAENLMKLADYFGVSVCYLMTGKEFNDSENESDDEKELLLMLRAAKRISSEDHDLLVSDFKRNITLYLEAKAPNLKESKIIGKDSEEKPDAVDNFGVQDKKAK